MRQEEKQKLADELKNAAEDVLNVGELEEVSGGLLDLKCVNNNVPLCGCTQTTVQDLKENSQP